LDLSSKAVPLKLRRIPEDFQVEELTQFRSTGGPFALYRMTKRSLGTPEAIEAVLRRWNLQRQQVSYGGLKDRHAVTVQYVTIKNGPRRDLREDTLELLYQGQAAQPFTPQDIAGNRFQIALRDLSPEAAQQAVAALERVMQDGLPNYFDDQRFGSVGASGEFIARPWCLGDYERVLWLALADPNEHDRPEDREEKRILRENWGDFTAAKAALGRSNRRSIVTFLADRPGDFRGAVARMRVDLRSLYLAAFQSALWNRILAAWIRAHCRPEQLAEVELKLGPVPFFTSLDAAEREPLANTLLPLPSARTKLEPGPIATLIETVLGEFGLEMRQIRVKYPRDSFFSKGERAASVIPKRLKHVLEVDELHPGRQKLGLRFELPRGSYATILVKRLTECG
jgi:tRNA pseudouridine13 synthase